MKKRNYKKIAKSVIDLEIKALKKLKDSINNSFNEAVESLANCQSKVILCGVGKSGLIAAKISATLSSVGTPSFSLSANDCSHGDLGSISKKDILILISYSGSTEELKNIIKNAVVIAEKDVLENLVPKKQIKLNQTPVSPNAIKERSHPAGLTKEMDHFEKEKLKEALETCVTTREIAEYLEISQSSVVRKLKKHALLVPDR